MTVAVVVEVRRGAVTPASLECVEEARGVASVLGEEVTAVGLGPGLQGPLRGLGAHGADRAIALDHEGLGPFSADAWLQALRPLLSSLHPRVLMTPATAHSRAWLPRYALRAGRLLVSGVAQVRGLPDGEVQLVRPRHGGLQEERLVGRPPLCTSLLPSVRGLETRPLGAPLPMVDVRRPDLALDAVRDRTVASEPPDQTTVDIEEAERIVAGGLGLGARDKVAVLEGLAGALRAAVGGTRVISDRGWIPHDRYIGSTGKTVAPRLYVALGISGASQHVVGITGSEVIVAVNVDRTAPIFSLADLGVVADVHRLAPHLERKLREALEAHRRRGEAPPRDDPGVAASAPEPAPGAP
ncbi:MAG: electron transfer flavoprotein subunit alpha/FixB family protein [Sandaracinaceae bacterium]